MKQKSVSMLLLAMSLGLLLGMSVASAEDTISYTGDAYESKCNVCLEATVLDVNNDPNSGILVKFKINDGGWGGSSVVGTATTDDDGIAALCIGEKAPGEYRVRAIIVGAGGVTDTSDLYVYEARATGGGQARAKPKPSDILHPKKKDWYKISFGMGIYRLGAGVFSLDSCEVTFHNVSVDAIDQYKFVADADGITNMECKGGTGTVIRLDVDGLLYNEEGGSVAADMIIRVQDLGEPNVEDNLRFVLKIGGSRVYDTDDDGVGGGKGTGDFSPEPLRGRRTILVKGNLQVECPVVCPVP